MLALQRAEKLHVNIAVPAFDRTTCTGKAAGLNKIRNTNEAR